MNSVFGVSMNTIMIVLVAILAICLLFVAWTAIRQPVIFKMGLRNIPRRPAQTVLIVIGLMLSTMIIAAALGTGDTIDYSATLETYNLLGTADELVVASSADDGSGSIQSSLTEHIPQDAADRIDAEFAGSGLVDGVMPVLIESVPVALIEGGIPAEGADLMTLVSEDRVVQSEPAVNLVGIDPARLDQFGGVQVAGGGTVDFSTLGADQIVISEKLAGKLGAEVGDVIAFTFANRGYFLEVAAVAVDSPLSGQFDTVTPGMVMQLDRLQSLTGRTGQITTVAVSNTGDVRTGMALTDEVTTRLQALFAGEPIGVDPIKQDSVDLARTFANVFSTFFLIFGLFSIAVGILLIVLIFTMLAAERRPEMGMARAVGAQRSQLIQQFVSEGSAYSLVAGLVGTALGVAAAWAIALALKPLFGDFFTIEPHVTPRSMVVAYALGVVITFVAVVASSWSISRLNIVAAIRDIPDVTIHERRVRTLVYGILLAALGAIAAFGGLRLENAFQFYLGMSLLPFGLAMIARYFGVASRLVWSVVAVYLLVLWLLPDNVADRIFGPLDGGIELFFLSGIFLVTGSTLLIVQNLDVLLGLVSRIGSVFRSALPAVRTAIAFPGAAPGRTGLTVAMFSLIVFSLVMFSTINQNFVNLFLGEDANAGWDVRVDQGLANPIGTTDDFLALLAERGVDTTQITAAGSGTTWFQEPVRLAGTDAWKNAVVHGIDDDLTRESVLTFQQRAAGYPDDAAVIEALLTDPTVAVIDASALPENAGFGGNGGPDPFILEDPDGDGPATALKSGVQGFTPYEVELESAAGDPVRVRIIAIIDSRIGTFFGLYAPMATVASAVQNPTITSWFVRLADPSTSTDMAREIERALLVNGAQAVSIRDELADQQSQNRAFLYILQGFMGLGLIVGIAAVGVIAFRSVVERRQQIGVLRAIGYQREMVSLSFLIETAFIVLMGVLSGTILAVILARNLFADESFAPTGTQFVIPWTIIIVVIAITVIAALLMTIVPSRQAASLSPAEALRYE